MQKDNIRENILEAIAFFDLFNSPLTSFEIWQALKIKASLNDVISELFEMKDNLLVEKNGFFALINRIEIIDKKSHQHNLSEYKFEIAKKAVSILRFINGVKMVAVCNNFFYKKESDIDFFIITSKNRIWLTRFLTVISMQILGLRIDKKNTKDRICLSFYISEDNLSLEKIALKEKDPYLYHWFAKLIPIYGEDIYENFFRNNLFIKNKLPNSLPKKRVEDKIIKDNMASIFIKSINSVWFYLFPGSLLEKFASWIQARKIPENIRSIAKEDNTNIIMDSTMLKFHINDRRVEYRDKLKSKINEISL